MLAPDSWPSPRCCSEGGLQKLLGEGLPHLCTDGRAAGLRVPLHSAITHNVGQWPPQTSCFVRLHKRQAGEAGGGGALGMA